MALQCSTAAANARLDATEVAIGASPLMRLYSGTIPADCAAALSGNTLIAETVLPSDWLSSAAAGSKAATPWPSTAAIAAGTATFFRVYDSSGVTCHVQGSVSTIGAGGSMQFASTTFAVGDGVAYGGFVLRAPEAPAFQGSLAKTLGAATLSASGTVANSIQGSLAKTLGAATLSASGTVANSSWTSTRFNAAQYTNQWVYRSSSMPTSGGILVSLWAKMPTPVSSHPTTLGNTEVLRIDFANWFLRCISFNFGTTSGSTGDMNTNSMLFADGTSVSESASSWANDTTYLLDTGVPWSYENGWVFLAWQAVCDGSGNITLRQWVRYAGQAVQGPYTTSYTLAGLRADLVANAGWTNPHANAWTPSQTISDVRINGDDGNDAYIIHARVEDVTGTPTNAHILDISNLTAADTTAWADWSLEWNGSADLTDRSGNSRGLTSMGGSLSAGGTFP